MKRDNRHWALFFGIKILFVVCLVSLTSLELFAQTDSQAISDKVVNGGIGLGSVIAVVVSWSRSQSVLWAILHGILSWFYVIYFVLTRKKN